MEENFLNKKENINLDSYNDPQGLTVKKMNFGLWFLENRPMFKKIFILFLVAFSGVTWSYSLFTFTYYFTTGMQADNKMYAESVSGGMNLQYLRNMRPQGIELGRAEALSGGENKADIFITVKNPNSRHAASFDYSFLTGGEEVGFNHGYLLPEETKYLVALAIDGKKVTTYPELKLVNVKWTKLDKRKYPDFEKFKKDHLSVAIANIKFTLPDEAEQKENTLPINLLEFDVMNSSPYSYKNIDFIMLLKGGPESIVAVNKISAPNFSTGESRHMAINWPGNYMSVGSAEVLADLDILDPYNYMNLTGEVREENREVPKK